MQPIRVDVVPVFGGDDVGDGVGEVVADHLRVPGGAGGEIEQHRVVGAGGNPLGEGSGLGQHPVKVQPSFPLAPDDKPGPDAGIGFHRLFDVGGGLVLGAGDDGRNAGALKPVDVVFGGQQVGCRNRNRPDFVQP